MTSVKNVDTIRLYVPICNAAWLAKNAGSDGRKTEEGQILPHPRVGVGHAARVNIIRVRTVENGGERLLLRPRSPTRAMLVV